MFLPWSNTPQGQYLEFYPLPHYSLANGRHSVVAKRWLLSILLQICLLGLLSFIGFYNFNLLSIDIFSIFRLPADSCLLAINSHDNFLTNFHELCQIFIISIFLLAQIYVLLLFFLSILTLFLFGGVTCSRHFQTLFYFIAYITVLLSIYPYFQIRICWNFLRYFTSPNLFREALFQDFFFLFQRFDTFFLFPPLKPDTLVTSPNEVSLTPKKHGTLKTTSKFTRFSLRIKQTRFQLGKFCTHCDVTLPELYTFLDDNKEHLEEYQTLCIGAFLLAPSST